MLIKGLDGLSVLGPRKMKSISKIKALFIPVDYRRNCLCLMNMDVWQAKYQYQSCCGGASRKG